MGFPLIDATIWVGAYDLSGDTNRVELAMSAAAPEIPAFGNDSIRRLKGLRDTTFSHESYAGYENPDLGLWQDFDASAANVITCSPTGEEGDVAYTFQARRFEYVPLSGSIGDVAGVSGSAAGANQRDGAVRATILRKKTTVTSTGLGTGYQLGTVATGQHVYGAVHVFEAGTSITLLLESATNSSFSSATVRATVGPLTSTGATWMTRVPGAINDDYWRVRISAVTGSFVIAAVVGIQ